MLTLLVFTLIALMAATTAAAQTPALAPCAPAGTSIQVQVSAAVFVPGDLTYLVRNNRRERIRWVRLGVGAGAPVQLPADITPRILQTPPNWRVSTVRSDDGSRVHFSWEAASDEAAIGEHEQVSLGLRAKQIRVARAGLVPLDFSVLPFSAGDDAGSCWFGTTSGRVWEPDGGYLAGLKTVTVRAMSTNGGTRLFVEAPAYEAQFRLKPRVFVTVPFAVTWGVKGGFSVDTSIGAGLNWSPNNYISASARISGGTLLFNHWTHLKTVGVDFNVPLARTVFAEGLTRQSKFLVIGVEYFDRHVDKLFGFLSGPAWYTSGHGFAVRVGIRRLSWDTSP